MAKKKSKVMDSQVIETVTPVETVETVETVTPVETVETVETVTPVETVETVTPVETVETVETVTPVETVETVTPVETVETVTPVEPIKAGRGRKPVPWKGLLFETRDMAIDWLKNHAADVADKVDVRETRISPTGTRGKPKKGTAVNMFKLVLHYEDRPLKVESSDAAVKQVVEAVEVSAPEPAFVETENFMEAMSESLEAVPVV